MKEELRLSGAFQKLCEAVQELFDAAKSHDLIDPALKPTLSLAGFLEERSASPPPPSQTWSEEEQDFSDTSHDEDTAVDLPSLPPKSATTVRSRRPVISDAETDPTGHPPILRTPPSDAKTDPGTAPLPAVAVPKTDSRPSGPAVRVANAHQGQLYRGALTVVPAAKVVSVEGLEALGLRLEGTDLVGTPVDAGEFRFTVHLMEEGGKAPQVVSAHIIVNPDPRSLWREIDPADPSHAKPHFAVQTIEESDANLIAVSRRGRSHAHGGAYREDDFAAVRHASGWWVSAVSDGAGSAAFSRLGSKLVCENAVSAMTELLDQGWGRRLPSSESDRLKLELEWATQVSEAMKKATYDALVGRAGADGFAADELSATLLLSAMRQLPGSSDWLVFTFGIGDGAMGVITETGAQLLSEPDSGVFAGQTKFTILPDVWNEASARSKLHRISHPRAFLSMTDGISDPKFSSSKAMREPGPWRTLFDEMQPPLSAETLEAQGQALLEWIHFFHAGEHDDRTLVVFRPRLAHA